VEYAVLAVGALADHSIVIFDLARSVSEYSTVNR